MAISMLSAISFYSRYSAPTVDADGDTIPDAPAPAEPATAVIEPATQAEESSWLDRLVNWLIPDDVAETTAQVSTTSPTAACGLMAESMPHEHADGGADVVEDIDADGDTVPDQPDVEVHDDGDGPDIPEDIQPEDTPPDEVPDEVTDDGPDGEVPGVCDRSPSAFNLESPTNDATGQSVQPLLNWQDSTDPDAGDSISYQIRVCTDPSCGTVLINRSGLTNSQYQVQASEELDFNADYYWRVQAEDTCPTSVDSTPLTYHFRTALPGVCTTFPSVFNLSTPNDGVTGVVTTPTFDWTDSTDPDAGDSVTYRLIVDDNSDFSSPVLDRPGLIASQYTVLSTEALAEGITYYWKVEANDTCAQTTDSSSTRSFTTQAACTPGTVSETAAWAGTINSLDEGTLPGTLMLNRSWTTRWSANEGILPSADVPAWTLYNPGGGSIPTLGIDPASGEAALLFNTVGLDNTLRYTIDPGSFSNVTGWAFQFRARLVSTEGATGDETSVEVADASRITRMGLAPTSVVEAQVGSSYGPFDTTSNAHTYRVQAIGPNFSLFIDEGDTPVLTGTMGVGGGSNYIRFGDMWANPDSVAYWNHVYFYTGGNVAPFMSPGSYSRIIDAGTSTNDFGSGAMLTYASVEPVGTSLIVETRTGDTSSPDGSWSSWAVLTGGAINSPAARYLEARFTLSTTIPSASPRLNDYTINYCTY